MGHAVGAIANGDQPTYVELRFGLFGGLTGGFCDFQIPTREAPKLQRIGYLVALMAGHAADIRFCQLYLGMDHRAAFTDGRDWAESDYANVAHFRSQLGLGWGGYSRDEAFTDATGLVERNGDYLDEMTLRLCRERYIDGSQL
jgi:hypothetical protein